MRSPPISNIAIVGLGLIGIRHLRALQAAGNAKLHSIVDRTQDSKLTAKECGVPHFDCLEELLKQPNKSDGVIIATPNALHVCLAKMCVAEHIPVLVEKPLATDIASAEELLTLAEAQATPILTGYFRRYNPTVEATKQQITQGTIGDIVSIHSHFWLYKHKEYFDSTWRKEKDGGPLHINLAHDIDILLYLVGDIQQVKCYQSNKVRGFAVEDSAVIICQFSNGALGTINLSDTIPSPWSWELTAGDNPVYPQTDQSYCYIGGTKGAIAIPKNTIWCYQNQDEGNWYTPIDTITFKKSVQDPLVAQIEHFARVITGQEQPLVTGKDGLRAMRVIDAIKRSAQTNESICL